MLGFGFITRFIGRVLAVILGVAIINKLKGFNWDDDTKILLIAVGVLILIFVHIMYSGRPIVHVG